MKSIKSFFRQFKEETVMIPLLMLVIEFSRRYLMDHFPEMGTFIPEAELFVFVVKLWQMLWATSAIWLVTRIVFKPVYLDLVDTMNFYNSKFVNIDDARRSYFSLSVFIGLLFAFIMLFNGANGATSEELLRKRLCDTLSTQLNVRELTGHNDGSEVALRLKAVGINFPANWCGGHVGYNFQIFAIPNPNSAWSPAYANVKYKTNNAQPGDVFTLYYKNLKRVGHVGFVVAVTHGYYKTNEGNTGGSGVRDGDGVHSYLRNPALVYQVNDYITPYFKQQLNTNEKAFNPISLSLLNAIGLQNKTEHNQEFRNLSGFERYIFNYYYNNLQGQHFACDWRQFINPFANEQYRASFTANSRDCQDEAGSEKCEWSTNCELQMQGFGVDCKTTGENNKGIQGVYQLLGENQKFRKGESSANAIYSKVGLVSNVHRWSFIFDSPIYIFKETESILKDNRCWKPMLA